MKNIILILSALIAVTSCGKKELDPVIGYNSVLLLNKISFTNLYRADSIVGQINYLYIVNSDTSASGTDTITFRHSFSVKATIADQRIDLNTPDKAKSARLNVGFRIYGGMADEVKVEEFIYEKDKKTLIKQPIYFNTKDSLFTAEPVIINF